MKRVLTVLLVVLCAASLLVSAVALVRFRAYERGIIEPLKQELVERTREATEKIEAFLQPATDAAEALASRLSASEPTHAELTDELRATILGHDSFYGGTVAYQPFRFDPERRLYAPYFARKNGGAVLLQIEDEYDYTAPEHEWYVAAVAEGSRWSEPYFDESIGDIFMTTYSAVFREVDARTARGVVTIDIPMETIHEVVRSLDLGAMGYALLLSRQGRFLYHPDEELVRSGVSVREAVSELGDAELASLLEQVLADDRGMFEYTSHLTGSEAWFVFEPIASAEWTLVSVYLKDDVPGESTALRRQLVICIGSTAVFLITALALGLNVLGGEKRPLWICSLGSAAILAAAIGLVWSLALHYDDGATGKAVMTNDLVSLEAFMDGTVRRAEQRLSQPPTFLPTGLWVDSVRFNARSDVQMRGLVWQRFDPRIHADLAPGFTLRGVSALFIGEPVTEPSGSEKVVRWPFETTLRVRLDYSRYPLMKERIQLRIAHRELARNVILVPDLDAYPILSPVARPGLDQSVFLPGWDVKRSFFGLEARRETTDFGLRILDTGERAPSLHYNIEIDRNFIDSFVSNLVPLIIVAVVIFLVLMISTRDQHQVERLRTGTGFNLSICATLLFVVVLSHIGIRQKIAAQEIIYLEYFYLVMYLSIIWVAINSILLALAPDSWLTRHEQNLLPRVLFWPLLLGAILIVTLFTFY